VLGRFVRQVDDGKSRDKKVFGKLKSNAQCHWLAVLQAFKLSVTNIPICGHGCSRRTTDHFQMWIEWLLHWTNVSEEQTLDAVWSGSGPSARVECVDNSKCVIQLSQLHLFPAGRVIDHLGTQVVQELNLIAVSCERKQGRPAVIQSAVAVTQIACCAQLPAHSKKYYSLEPPPPCSNRRRKSAAPPLSEAARRDV